MFALITELIRDFKQMLIMLDGRVAMVGIGAKVHLGASVPRHYTSEPTYALH